MDSLPVSWTNEEATRCRAACVDLGLLEDPFVHAFVPILPGNHVTPEPIILRGTVIRTVTMDSLLSAALIANSQVVNLGCGFDTRSAKHPNHVFYEVDLNDVLSRKQQVFTSTARLIDCDLNDVDLLFDKLVAAGLSFEDPIVILAECCLMYLQRDSVVTLFSKIRQHCHAKLDIITFDALQLEDQFGKRMSINLPVEMPLFKSCRRVDDYLTIFTGFRHIDHFDMRHAEGLVKRKLNSKCALDELEEWHLITAHYLFCHFTN